MVKYKDFSLTPITNILKKNGPAILTVLLAIMMIGGALRISLPLLAADLVCGDGNREEPEACDDGNLQSGDGCSSSCSVEQCGNTVIDAGEQCDDGNLRNNDGCNRHCQIEFCGDRVIQETRGEQCDDGNGISGDGCSSSCQIVIDPGLNITPIVEVAPAQKPLTLMEQAVQAQKFLKTPPGEDFAGHLTDPETIQLETILKKLANGKRLTAQERAWALTLYTALQEARSAERVRYTDLLKQFIATPISSEVVDEKNLQKSHLVDVEVPIAIDELQRAVAVIRRGDLKNAVTAGIARLQHQGIDLAADAPVGFERYLTAGNQPIVVFATLKTLKEAAERYATTNVPLSLEIIRREAQMLKNALPIFEQEYGLTFVDIEPLLTAIEKTSMTVTKKDLSRIVDAVNQFLAVLTKKHVLSEADMAIFENDQAHAAAASRIVEDLGRTDLEVTPETLLPFLDALSASAPESAKNSFEHGSVPEQRSVLLEFLANDDRVSALRTILRDDGRTDLDQRYAALVAAIAHLGNATETPDLCDDSVPEALTCTQQYLTDLQDAVRDRSFFSRLVGTLQDFFGIGS